MILIVESQTRIIFMIFLLSEHWSHKKVHDFMECGECIGTRGIPALNKVPSII